MELKRRDVLVGMAAAGVYGLTGCGFQNDISGAVPEFPLGIASGDVDARGAVFWTHTVPNRSVELAVWQDGAESLDGAFRIAGTADESGCVLIDVDALQSATRYNYQFTITDGEPAGAASPIGQFRTAIADDALTPLLIGATSCTKLGFSMATLDRAAERDDLDLFLLLGDTAYADDANELNDYRTRWKEALQTRSQRQFRAAHAILATWDDHEFANNWNGETLAPHRFDAASRAFFEHQPVRRDPLHPRRVWRSVRWGRTAEFFLLDGRGERRPSTRHQANAEYLSREQLEWLKTGLAQSKATFKIILNSVPIAEYPGALFQPFASDRWEGYPAQREELLRFIEDAQLRGILWLAGDFHLASMGRLSERGPGKNMIEALVGPGANAPNPSPTYPSAPQFDWSSGVNNYATIGLEPTRGEAQIRYYDGTGALLADRTYVL